MLSDKQRKIAKELQKLLQILDQRNSHRAKIKHKLMNGSRVLLKRNCLYWFQNKILISSSLRKNISPFKKCLKKYLSIHEKVFKKIQTQYFKTIFKAANKKLIKIEVVKLY